MTKSCTLPCRFEHHFERKRLRFLFSFFLDVSYKIGTRTLASRAYIVNIDDWPAVISSDLPKSNFLTQRFFIPHLISLLYITSKYECSFNVSLHKLTFLYRSFLRSKQANGPWLDYESPAWEGGGEEGKTSEDGNWTWWMDIMDRWASKHREGHGILAIV